MHVTSRAIFRGDGVRDHFHLRFLVESLNSRVQADRYINFEKRSDYLLNCTYNFQTYPPSVVILHPSFLQTEANLINTISSVDHPNYADNTTSNVQNDRFITSTPETPNN